MARKASRTRIILVGCGKQKQTVPRGDNGYKIEDLYTGPIFKARAAYARDLWRHDPRTTGWWVVSAKLGLVHPTYDYSNPYDLTITQLSYIDRQLWSLRVLERLLRRLQDQPVAAHVANLQNLVLELHMGTDYAALLCDKIVTCGMNYSWPLQGLSQGEQLRWYKQRTGSRILS